MVGMGRRVVYSTEHGGFALSPLAAVFLAGRGESEAVERMIRNPLDEALANGSVFYAWEIPRHSDSLLMCIDELGLEKVAGANCELAVFELNGDRYIIHDYDGKETVIEPKDIEWITVEERSEQGGEGGVE